MFDKKQHFELKNRFRKHKKCKKDKNYNNQIQLVLIKHLVKKYFKNVKNSKKQTVYLKIQLTFTNNKLTKKLKKMSKK